MNKIKICEFVSIFLILTLSGMMVFGYALAGDTVRTPSGASTNTATLQQTGLMGPSILSPNITKVYTGKLQVEVLAHGSTHGYYTLLNPTSLGTSDTTVRYTSKSIQINTEGKLIFPELDISSYPSGNYPLMVIVHYSYPETNGKMIKSYVKIGIQNLATTATTISANTVTTKTTAYSGTNTTIAKTTDASLPSVSIDEELKLLETNASTSLGASVSDVYEKIIKTEEEKQLPAELKYAPESLIIKAEKAEIEMIDDTKGTVKFTGKAEPDQLIYLYIFSDPIVVSVKSDSNGDWEYELDDGLDTGEHKIYVAVKNDDNTIKAKSSALSFFVGNVVAASTDENQVATTTKSSNYLFYYIMFAVSFVTLIISVIFYMLTKKKIRQHELKLQD